MLVGSRVDLRQVPPQVFTVPYQLPPELAAPGAVGFPPQFRQFPGQLSAPSGELALRLQDGRPNLRALGARQLLQSLYLAVDQDIVIGEKRDAALAQLDSPGKGHASVFIFPNPCLRRGSRSG